MPVSILFWHLAGCTSVRPSMNYGPQKGVYAMIDQVDKFLASSVLDAERPLITFAVISYNEESFIREAVQGAFSQTYSPLEIILSDDCSTDRTFEIIQEEAARYRGPHKIVLNRNNKNLGIGFHLNQVMSLVSGFMVVIADGDDISLPERTIEIYKAWVDSDKTAFSIDSACVTINESSNIINRPPLTYLPQEHQLLFFSKTLRNCVYGASHAWHRKVFDLFGPLPNIACQDLVIPPRSILLGKVVRINRALVQYRIHESNVYSSQKQRTAQESIERSVYFFNDKIKICTDVVRCINEYKTAIQDPSLVCELDECVSNINRNRDKLALKVKIFTGYPIVRLIHLFKHIFLYGLQLGDMTMVAYAISRTVHRLAREIFYLRQRIVKTFSKNASQPKRSGES